jgi:hypothetical protein
MKGGKEAEDRKAALDLFMSSYIPKNKNELEQLLAT